MNDSIKERAFSLDESFFGRIDLSGIVEESVNGGAKKVILDGKVNETNELFEPMSQNGNPDFDFSQLTKPVCNSTPAKDKNSVDSSFFGLPGSVKNLFRDHKNIRDLYPWQVEVMGLKELKNRTNLLLILPTSGGKTLIAELLILREILCNLRDVLFILPYISLVHEKLNSLSPFALSLGFLLEEYAGSKGKFPPTKRRNKNSVFIATIEKADSFVNSLIEVGRFEEIGLVVIDEFHLVGESVRGAVIESVVVKVLHTNPNCQIITMSATVGNPEELKDFINGYLYQRDFRPVDLQEFVKMDDNIYKVSTMDEEILTFDSTFKNKGIYHSLDIDPDRIGFLVSQVIPDKSCLVFCATKKNCENMAELLCKTLSKELIKYKSDEKNLLFKTLYSEGQGNICKVLRRTLHYGIAYHHSGLTNSERKVIEEGFLSNVICCICCTSTLAAGVNLPASRVIIRSPFVGCNFISPSQYKQMIGRAGRAGLAEKGDSYLVCRNSDAENVLTLLKSAVGDCHSQLQGEPFLKLILSCLFLKIAKSRDELVNIFRQTLLAKQSSLFEINVEDQIDLELSKLRQSNTITQAGDAYELTKIGIAAIKGNFTIEMANQVFDDLVQAKWKLVLPSNLHLLYLVTPHDYDLNLSHDVISNILLSLTACEMAVANALGITESTLIKVTNGRHIPKRTVQLLKRLLASLLLKNLVEGQNIWEVSRKYGLDRGLIFSFLSSASSFTSAVLRFCEVFPDELWTFSRLLEDFPQKISFCCSQELIPLMELPAVRLGRARQLYHAGFKTIESIAAVSPKDLSQAIDLLPYKQARMIVSSAKIILLSKAEDLQEAAKGILEGFTPSTP